MKDPESYRRWAALRTARDEPGADQEALAPAEHAAYAFHRVRERPVYGAVEQALLIPAYQLAKLLRVSPSRTGPSWEQFSQANEAVDEATARNVEEALGLNRSVVNRAALPAFSRSRRFPSEEQLRAWILRDYARSGSGGQ